MIPEMHLINAECYKGFFWKYVYLSVSVVWIISFKERVRSQTFITRLLKDTYIQGGDALTWCHHCVLVACLCMLPHMKHLELSSTEELLRALSGLWIIQTRTARYVSEKHSGGQGGDSCTHTKHKHTLQQLYIDRVFKCVRKGRTDGLQACRDLDQAWGIPNKHAKRMLSYQKLASASH